MKLGVIIGSLLLILFCMKVETLSSERKVEFKVENDGAIKWRASEKLGTGIIRWQIQGYHVLLDKTKIGEPLKGKKKTEYIALEVDGRNVSVREDKTNKIKKGYQLTRFKLKGSYIKKQIKKNPEFYQAFLKKVKEKNDETLYLNAYFETYEIVPNGDIRDRVIKGFKSAKRKDLEGKYYVINGKYYDFDSRKNIVKMIRKRNLSDLKSIQEAEAWTAETKRQWNSKDYYNYQIKYSVNSNAIIRFVDEKERNLGVQLPKRNKIQKYDIKEIKYKNMKIFNPRSAFHRKDLSSNYIINDKEGKFGDEVLVEKIDKLSFGSNGKKHEYELLGAYIVENKKKKRLPEEVKKGGKTYFSYRLDLFETELQVVYKEKGQPDLKKDEDKVSGRGDVYAEAKIGAGSIEDEDFNIEVGIPSGEEYYKQVKTPSYFLNYSFERKTGEKTYQAKSRITWNLTWKESVVENGKEKVVERSRSVPVDYVTEIKRPYSYWVIPKLEVYVPDGAYLSNPAIPDSAEKILPKGYLPPEIRVTAKKGEKDHLKKPKELEALIDLGTMSHEGKEVPFYEPDTIVNARVGKIRVRNDSLTFDGELIMDDSEALSETKAPEVLPAVGKMTDKKVLYSEGKTIDRKIKNGEYLSEGRVEYSLFKAVGTNPVKKFSFDISDINSIVVHTPAVCDYLIKDCREWCQLLKPDQSFHQLVLTKEFKIEVIARGRHLPLKGYGLRDYEKYSEKKEVIFPFDVYKGKELVKAGSAKEIRGDTLFTLPNSVKEGKYHIIIKNYATNAESSYQKEEYYANTERERSVAFNHIPVEVSGRLFDLTLTGIKHSNLWKEHFERGKYKEGIRLNDLPLIDGDHPTYKNEGSFKKGYAARLSVTSIGSYKEEPYGVGMDMKFYAYDKDYGKKVEADLYYEAVSEETGKSLGLVKVGGERDKKNLHFVNISGKKIPHFTYGKLLFPKELLHSKSSQAVQRWMGEYSLPTRIYICKKGFPLEEYMKKHLSLNFKEDFWIKEGKLVLFADVTTLKNGKKVLSYLNSENEDKGYLNNWKKETKARRKARKDGSFINFEPGELFIYDIEKNIWNERRAEVKPLG